MRSQLEQLSAVLKEEAEGLTEAIDDVIGSRDESEFGHEAFERALRMLRCVKIALVDEAKKLDDSAKVVTPGERDLEVLKKAAEAKSEASHA